MRSLNDLREQLGAIEDVCRSALAKRRLYKQSYDEQHDELEGLKTALADVAVAREVIKALADKVRERVRIHINAVVNAALEQMSGDRYEFDVEFVKHKDKAVANLTVIDHYQDGAKYNPIDGCGGGIVDVIGFALQMAAWSLHKTSPLLVADEPFRFVSEDKQGACSSFVKALSKELGLQVVLVSHADGIIDCADAGFKVANDGALLEEGISYVST
jgi:DNA repair exonuclease SbcCD ATPase subunit